MPAVRGREPTSSAMFTPENAWAGSSLIEIRCSRGKAQSSSSIATPSAVPTAAGISSRLSSTGWSGPSMAPLAIRKSRL